MLKATVITSQYCKPCKIWKPILMAAIPDAKILDVEDSPKEVALLDVESLPTTVFHLDGHEVGRIEGAMSKKSLEEYLETLSLQHGKRS